MMTKPYLPAGANREVLQWLRDAAQRNAERDAIDEAAGAAVPGQLGPSELLRTAAEAIVCGFRLKSWDEVGEALCLLLQAEHLVRQIEEQVPLSVKRMPG